MLHERSNDFFDADREYRDVRPLCPDGRRTWAWPKAFQRKKMSQMMPNIGNMNGTVNFPMYPRKVGVLAPC